MNAIASIIRIICGIAVITLSIATYNSNRAHITAGEAPEVFGHATSFSGWQLTLAFAVFGLIGIVLVIIGVSKLIKNSK